MKVTIKDKDALLSIVPDDLQTYLEENKWEYMEDIIRDDISIGSAWQKWNDKLHRWNYVRVLTDVTLGDYSARMSENMMEIESNTDESQLTIYAKITKQVLIFGADETVAEFLGE